jgi:hypothetical protein
MGVAIADGADCLADLAALKEQEDLFGSVASVATAWRAVQATTSAKQRAIPLARERIWNACSPVGPLTFDVDATLITAHSEKEDAAPTYKRGSGFSPLAAWCDNTNEPLAAILRPGNAAPTTPTAISSCWSAPYWPSHPSTAWAMKKATTPPPWFPRSWSGPTRPGPRTAS